MTAFTPGRGAWLAGLSALVLAACGDAPGPGASAADPGLTRHFDEVARETGLIFSHSTGSTGQFYFPEITAGGVALLDYDNDGDLDVYFTNGRILEPGRTPGDALLAGPDAEAPRNRLFRNAVVPEGRLRFDEVTAASGVGDDGYGMGVATGDYDNDGDVDLYVTNFGPNIFYRNNGDGTFSDISAAAGANDERWTASAAFLDFDQDGDLDLFMTNYVAFSVTDNKPCSGHSGRRDYCGPLTYPAVPDRLFRNDGGRFIDISQASGISSAFGSGLGVAVADFDGDGWPDIYVANDGRPNQLWRNQADGTFENVALPAGAAVNGAGIAEAGMGVTAGDFDSDGDEDLFMTHLISETNTLYENDGRGNFQDATNRFGLAASSLMRTGFGVGWFDVDNDADLDLFVANGAVSVDPELAGQDPFPFHQHNQFYLNDQGRFAEVMPAGDPALSLRETSRGAAFGDLDNDGDTDIVIVNANGPARLLLNRVGQNAASLTVRLVGAKTARDGSGARVALLRAGQATVWRRAHTGGSYLSAGDPRVLFGLGEQRSVDAIGVLWPGGPAELFNRPPSTRHITLREGLGEPWTNADGPLAP